MFELIKELTELPGMLGHEETVQADLRRRWEPHCQEIVTTGVGNLIARVGGRGPRLLIEAHADEIGQLVSAISPQGFLHLAPKNAKAGRPGRDLHLIGQPAIVQTERGPVEGILAAISGHVTPPDLRDRPLLGWGDVFVDLGVDSAAEARALGVRVGDGVIWNPPTRRLGRYIVGKAMDDRAALAIITALLERVDVGRLTYELFVASTVQEEIGLVGAHSLTAEHRFDMAIALDIGLAGDVPGVDPRELDNRLGGGPVLVHHDGTVHYHRGLTRALLRAAAAAGIPTQDAVYPRYSSDGHALIMAGVPTALLAFATRYTHSPYEMVAEQDLVQCVDLLSAFVTSPPPALG